MTKFQVQFEYHYFKHLANCPVASRLTVQAVTAKQAIAKALRRQAMPERLIQIVAKAASERSHDI